MRNKFPSNLVLVAVIIILILNLWSQLSLHEEVVSSRRKEDQRISELADRVASIEIPEVTHTIETNTIQASCDSVSMQNLDPEKYATFMHVMSVAMRENPEGFRLLVMYWATHKDGILDDNERAILESFLSNP